MDLYDLFRAARRSAWLVALSVLVAGAAWVVIHRTHPPAYSATIALTAQPSTTTSQTGIKGVDYLLASTAAEIDSQSFLHQVRAAITPGAREGPATISAAYEPNDALLVLTARARSGPAAVAWADAAGSTAQRESDGLTRGIAHLAVLGRAGAVSPKRSEAATLVSSVGAALLFALVAIVVANRLRRRGRWAERLGARIGIPVLGALPRAGDGTNIGAHEPAIALRQRFRSFIAARCGDHDGETTVAVISGWPREGRTLVTGVLSDHAGGHGDRRGPTVIDTPSLLESSEGVGAARRADFTLLLVDHARSTPAAVDLLLRDLRTNDVIPDALVVNSVTGPPWWKRVGGGRSRRTTTWRSPGDPPVRDRDGIAPTLSPPGTIAPGAGGALPRRLFRNVFSTYGAIALAGLSSLLVTPLVVHHLGKSQFGLYSLIITVTSYLALMNLGFGTATMKVISEDAGRDDERVVATFNTTLVALTAFGVLAAIVGISVSFVIPGIFGAPASLHTPAVISFSLLAVAVAIQLPGAGISGVITGYQRYDIQSGLDAVGIMFVGAGTIVALVLGGGLIAITAVAAGGTVVMAIIPWFPARRLAPGLRISRRLIDWHRLRELTRMSWWYLLQSVSSTINEETDLFVVGAVLGVRDAAVFAVGQQLASLAVKAATPFRAVFFPHVSSIGASETASLPTLRRVLEEGTRVTLLFTLPIVVFLVMVPGRSIEAWLGGGFGSSAGIVVALAAAALLNSAASVPAQILVGLGQARLAAILGGSAAVVNLVFSVVLALRFGAIGVAIGSAVSALVVTVPFTLVYACRLTGTTIGAWFRHAVLPHGVPVLVTAVALYVGRSHLHPRSLPVIAAAVATMILYVLTFGCVGATPDERQSMLRRYRQ